MAPSIVWGIGVGLIIAAVDAVAYYLAGSTTARDWPIDDIDQLVNVVLYSLIGFRVGKATGVVRDAAEAGVLAGVLVALIGIGVSRILPPPPDAVTSITQIVFVVALNVVLGGCLGIMAGWFGSRAGQGGPVARP